MRLAWATDIHLDFITDENNVVISARNINIFCERIKNCSPDAVIISGDISLSNQLKQHLLSLERSLGIPIFFVLGNHDFWGSNIGSVRKNISTLSNSSRFLRYLSTSSYIMLSNSTALVGHDGWYDGLNGSPKSSYIEMNDWNFISDFSIFKNYLGVSLDGILNVSRYQANIGAKHIEKEIKSAIRDHAPSKFIIVTHVPPFIDPVKESQHKNSTNLCPWYSSKIMGDMLLNVAKQNPLVEFEVFCGHVHTKYEKYISNNLLLRSGHSDYSDPKLQSVYNII